MNNEQLGLADMHLLVKELPGFSVYEVPAKDTELLEQVFKLRVTCRQDQGYITPEKYPNGWFDDVDMHAHHFVACINDMLIASSRISYYNNITEHYYYNYFEEINGYPRTEPVGYLSRVVVLPAYRRSGISKVLVRLREEHARKKNINHILTDVCDFQIDNFLKYGYTNLGMLHSEKIVWEVKPEDYYLMYKKLA